MVILTAVFMLLACGEFVKRMTKMKIINNKKWIFAFDAIMLMSLLAWVVMFVIDPNGKQCDLFFLRMGDFLADATNGTGLVSELDPYNNDAIGLWNAAYPPLAYLMFYTLSHVSTIPEESYLSYYTQPTWLMLFVICMIMLMICLYIFISYKMIFTSKLTTITALLLCFSRPVIYTIERGNILLLSALLVCIFVFYYDNKNRVIKEMSLISLSIAAGIKITPALFGILLIYKKDWKGAVRLSIYGLICLFVPFIFLKGGMHNVLLMLKNIQDHLLVHSAITGTSLVASYGKLMRGIFGDSYRWNYITYALIGTFSKVSGIYLLVGGFFLKEKWRIVLNVILGLLLIPDASGEYCMLYLIPFTVLFLNYICLKEKGLKVDDVMLFVAQIMIYFVYRCAISDILDFNFAIPVMLVIAAIRTSSVIFDVLKTRLIK